MPSLRACHSLQRSRNLDEAYYPRIKQWGLAMKSSRVASARAIGRVYPWSCEYVYCQRGLYFGFEKAVSHIQFYGLSFFEKMRRFTFLYFISMD